MTERLLLDSHTLIWALEGGQKLRSAAYRAINDSANEIFVSVVSVWELEIKRSSGRFQFSHGLVRRITAAGFTELPINFRHAEMAANLPLIHRDPFDRMLIAQAQAEALTLVTDDSQIARYRGPHHARRVTLLPVGVSPPIEKARSGIERASRIGVIFGLYASSRPTSVNTLSIMEMISSISLEVTQRGGITFMLSLPRRCRPFSWNPEVRRLPRSASAG